MHSYRVFGGVLCTELVFPRLPRAHGESADWTLSISSDTPPTGGDEHLGTDRVEPTIAVDAWRHADAYRLVYQDTGTFDVSGDGRSMTWYPAPGANEIAVRLDVLGRVFALAMHAQGRLALHASGVVIDGSAALFLAPKRSGKSTLGLALAGAGATLLADDMVPVDPREGGRAWPGTPFVRVHHDSARLLASGAPIGQDELTGVDKHTVTTATDSTTATTGIPLGALYLLESVEADRGAPAAERERLTGMAAVLALLGHTKLGPLLGGSEARVVLGRVASTARAGSVFRLRVARDFARLPEAVERILGWQSVEVVDEPVLSTVGA